MNVVRAKQLAEQYGKKLVDGLDSMLDLYGADGIYIDSLYPGQVNHLEEDDYIEFYLED